MGYLRPAAQCSVTRTVALTAPGGRYLAVPASRMCRPAFCVVAQRQQEAAVWLYAVIKFVLREPSAVAPIAVRLFVAPQTRIAAQMVMVVVPTGLFARAFSGFTFVSHGSAAPFDPDRLATMFLRPQE